MGAGGRKLKEKVKLGPPRARAPAKTPAPYGKKPVLNNKFKKKYGLQYSARSKEAQQSNTKPEQLDPDGLYVGLRFVDQEPYEVIVSLSNEESQQVLADAGVIGCSKETCLCWRCGFAMVGEEVLRCSNRQCEGRPRLHHSDLAFTALYDVRKGGGEVNYAQFLRAAYTLGVKMPADAACHIVRQQGQGLASARKNVDRYYAAMKVALAWTEHRRGHRTEYRGTVVEPDSGRMGTSKRAGEHGLVRSHEGRVLVLAARNETTWSAFSLPPCRSKDTGRGMGPEKASEIRGAFQKIDKSCIVAPDGAKAFKKVSAERGLAIAAGVNHQKKIFSPPSVLKKKTLSKAQQSTLKKMSVKKKPAAKQMKTQYVVAAGDNRAESCLGRIKQTMRRQQNVGRGGRQAAARRSVAAMSAAALTRCNGLQYILAAVSSYRSACLSGKCPVAPNLAFAHEALPWVYEKPVD
eukprot:Skav206922  [mRNA]  locus=scaffold808:924582:925967:- [translate_table: standard]